MGDISDKDKKNRGHHSGVRDARRAPACGRPSNTETPTAHQALEARGPEGESECASLYLLDCHYTIYGIGRISQLPRLPPSRRRSARQATEETVARTPAASPRGAMLLQLAVDQLEAFAQCRVQRLRRVAHDIETTAPRRSVDRKSRHDGMTPLLDGAP